MLFKTKEELDNYLADKTREIEERLGYELIDEKGITDMREVARLIHLEVEKEVKRILSVAEFERLWKKSKNTKLSDL